MKYSLFITSVILGILILWGCEELDHGPTGDDGIAPGKVTVGEIENLPGGAIINFTASTDVDVLYVQAIFNDDKGIEREVKASASVGSLMIEGFGGTGNYDVDLYAVDRSENKSEPATTIISPLEAPVNQIFPTLTASVDYGGVKVAYENETNAEVSLNVTVFDSLQNRMVYKESFFTSQTAGSYSFRGYESEKTMFGIYVEDKWGNTSDTLFTELWPIPDDYLDKGKFSIFRISGDEDWNQWGFSASQMWNDVWSSQWDCGSTNFGSLPMHLTIDLGVVAKLSRFKMYQRGGYELYKHGNPKRFKIFGIKDINSLPPFDPENPNAGWTLLKDCTSFKPSGSPLGIETGEDIAFQEKGEDFEFDVQYLQEVRYVRFEIDETWGGLELVVIGELAFWGDIIESEL